MSGSSLRVLQENNLRGKGTTSPYVVCVNQSEHKNKTNTKHMQVNKQPQRRGKAEEENNRSGKGTKINVNADTHTTATIQHLEKAEGLLRGGVVVRSHS